MLSHNRLSGLGITEHSKNIPFSLTSDCARSIAACTAATSPVSMRYDFPHIPLAILNSIKSTIEVFAAASAATIIEAAENVSNTPNAFTFSTFAAP